VNLFNHICEYLDEYISMNYYPSCYNWFLILNVALYIEHGLVICVRMSIFWMNLFGLVMLILNVALYIEHGLVICVMCNWMIFNYQIIS